MFSKLVLSQWRRALCAVALASGALVGFAWTQVRPSAERAEGPVAQLAQAAAAPASRPPASALATSLTTSVPHAYIPPQCYTKTRGDGGEVFNPCFTCHVESQAPNYVSDADLQLGYDFPERARSNPWTNLFVDRRARIAASSDDEVLTYVRRGNYLGRDGQPLLAARLQALPPEWDVNHNGSWDGYVPDAYFDFDEQGFDHAPGGAYSGWRVYSYYPLPGSFWPTNGSMGDALLRLPASFRETEQGTFDRALYELNLAIVEALIQGHDVSVPPTDERLVGVDLDLDGKLGAARHVAFQWQPGRGTRMGYVGRAGQLQRAGELPIAAGLFPVGTELLHSVRYLDVAEEGVTMAARLKELRYARKTRWAGYGALATQALHAGKEKHDSPDNLERFPGGFEGGVTNRQGWTYQGFIEDAVGELRPQTYQETLFCVGCHGGVGATTDGVFSFARKLDAETFRAGWFHESQRSLRGLPEPRRRDGRYEYSLYLELNRAGDDLRSNTEVQQRFFDGTGQPRAAAFSALHRDVALLLLPSPARALALDKAYREVVVEQSFERGRDAVLKPAFNVHRLLEPQAATGIEQAVPPPWRQLALAKRN